MLKFMLNLVVVAAMFAWFFYDHTSMMRVFFGIALAAMLLIIVLMLSQARKPKKIGEELLHSLDSSNHAYIGDWGITPLVSDNRMEGLIIDRPDWFYRMITGICFVCSVVPTLFFVLYPDKIPADIPTVVQILLVAFDVVLALAFISNLYIWKRRKPKLSVTNRTITLVRGTENVAQITKVQTDDIQWQDCSYTDTEGCTRHAYVLLCTYAGKSLYLCSTDKQQTMEKIYAQVKDRVR